MKAPPIEDDEPVGFHLDELEQLPIFVAIVDVSILPAGKERVEDHAVLKVFVPFRALEEFVAQFQSVCEIPDLLIWGNGQMLQSGWEMSKEPRPSYA